MTASSKLEVHTKLTEAQREELTALRDTNDRLNGPSFMWRGNWHDSYRTLVRRGLVKWGEPPAGFDRKRFAGATITDLGRSALSEEQR